MAKVLSGEVKYGDWVQLMRPDGTTTKMWVAGAGLGTDWDDVSWSQTKTYKKDDYIGLVLDDDLRTETDFVGALVSGTDGLFGNSYRQ